MSPSWALRVVCLASATAHDTDEHAQQEESACQPGCRPRRGGGNLASTGPMGMAPGSFAEKMSCRGGSVGQGGAAGLGAGGCARAGQAGRDLGPGPGDVGHRAAR